MNVNVYKKYHPKPEQNISPSKEEHIFGYKETIWLPEKQNKQQPLEYFKISTGKLLTRETGLQRG